VRVYVTNAPAGGLTLLDLATVTGTAGGASLTLYEKQSVNGALGQTTPWSLFAAGDGAALTTRLGLGDDAHTGCVAFANAPRRKPSPPDRPTGCEAWVIERLPVAGDGRPRSLLHASTLKLCCASLAVAAVGNPVRHDEGGVTVAAELGRVG